MTAVLLEWTRWSLISLISTVALFVIITSFLWATLANALNRFGHQHPLHVLSCTVTPPAAQRVWYPATPYLLLPHSPDPCPTGLALNHPVAMQAGAASTRAAARRRERVAGEVIR